MAPSKTTTDTDGFDHTSVTCKAFAALLCVSSVAVGCTMLVSALKTQDPIGIYRPDAVRRELPRDGPFMAVETANPRGLHGPGAVSPTKEEFQAHLGEFAKKKGAGWLFNRKHRGKGGGGRGKGKGGGRGGPGGLPFGHAGMRGPTGDFLWDRGAGRRGHHVESGIGPMQVQAADYDEEEAMGKVRGCLLNLDRSGAQMVPGERGFYPSPAKWAQLVQSTLTTLPHLTQRCLAGQVGAYALMVPQLTPQAGSGETGSAAHSRGAPPGEPQPHRPHPKSHCLFTASCASRHQVGGESVTTTLLAGSPNPNPNPNQVGGDARGQCRGGADGDAAQPAAEAALPRRLDHARPHVESKACVAWVPAPRSRLIGRGWSRLGAV